MRALLVASIVVVGLAAGLQTAGGAPSLPDAAIAGSVPRAVPAASHKCGKGQYWVPSGYAKHGKYRAGHCAPQ
jgi:hypothetical protein